MDFGFPWWSKDPQKEDMAYLIQETFHNIDKAPNLGSDITFSETV